MATFHETSSIIPEGENLRRAVRYVEEFNMGWTGKTVNEVSQRFDLSVLQEEFLIQQFVQKQGIGG